MAGIDATTGLSLNGIDHLRQSVVDILTTPIGSRVMRRTYGSTLPSLVDRPVDGSFVLDLFVASAQALRRWEPRIEVTRITLEGVAPVAMKIEGIYRVTGRPVALEGITVT